MLRENQRCFRIIQLKYVIDRINKRKTTAGEPLLDPPIRTLVLPNSRFMETRMNGKRRRNSPMESVHGRHGIVEVEACII